MSELAYDVNGYPIRLPPEATKFLVRKHKPKSPPQVLFRNGRRATLPVGAGIEDFRHLIADSPGRYRLLALDEADQPVEGAPEAYVEIDPEPAHAYAPPAPAPDPLAPTRAALSQQPTELLLLETMRANTELARSVIDRLPDIMKASAFLLSAADSAGMPRRPPLWLEDDYDDDDDQDDEQPPAPAAPSLFETFCKAALSSGGNFAGFAKLLGAGNAAPGAAGAPAGDGGATAAATEDPPARPAAPPRPAAAPTGGASRNAAPATPPVDPQAHLVAILSQLSESERAYAQRVLEQLSPAAIKEWHGMLLSMGVDEAVSLIRTKAQGQET